MEDWKARIIAALITALPGLLAELRKLWQARKNE
jgi:hypothetical protein